MRECCKECCIENEKEMMGGEEWSRRKSGYRRARVRGTNSEVVATHRRET